MENTTTSKKEYKDKWHDYIETLNMLTLVNDEALSKEVREAVERLQLLVEKVAEVKFKKIPSECKPLQNSN